MLDTQQITAHLLSCVFTKPFQLHLFRSIDSTNTFLKKLPTTGLVDICCAEEQTQGRGRFGRHWHAPFGENICCSSKWHFNGDMAKLSGLSLVTSLAVLATIKSFADSPQLKVKWPNDILWDDKKLCGCLIEIVAESRSEAQVIVGVGLNTNTDTLNESLPEKPWCSLFEISGHTFNRNQIIASLIKNLDLYFEKFTLQGWEIFQNEWDRYDYLTGHIITVSQGLQVITGVAQGLDPLGQLILIDKAGNRHCFSSGEATLQK